MVLWISTFRSDVSRCTYFGPRENQVSSSVECGILLRLLRAVSSATRWGRLPVLATVRQARFCILFALQLARTTKASSETLI